MKSGMQLIANNLTCVRGGQTIFADLSFVLGSGTGLVLTGPNGSGKSSLLRLIAGLLEPAAGEISVKPGGSAPAHLMHYVGHRDAVKHQLTVEEGLTFWASYLGGTPGEVGGALERFGLSGLRDVPAAYLSAGQKRRLALARLLLGQRPIWLLDEPTNSLDAAAQTTLGEVMRDHLLAGGLLVAATHADLPLEQVSGLELGVAARQVIL